MKKVIIGTSVANRIEVIAQDGDTVSEILEANSLNPVGQVFFNAVPMSAGDMQQPLSAIAPTKDTVFISWNMKTPDNA